MNTIISIVEKITKQQPFLTKMLSDELINLSSLARKIKPDIEKDLRKEVQIGSVVMALKRLVPILQGQDLIMLNRFSDIYVNITVRSNLCIHTYENSKTLVFANMELMERLSDEKNFFHTVSCGIYETSIVIGDEHAQIMEEVYKNEKQVVKLINLSSITMNLESIYAESPGLYHNIFSKIAWLGISVKEVISTSHEISLIIDDNDTAKTYSCIKELFNKKD